MYPQPEQESISRTFFAERLDLEVYLDGRRLKKGRQLFWPEKVHPPIQNPGYAYVSGCRNDANKLFHYGRSRNRDTPVSESSMFAGQRGRWCPQSEAGGVRTVLKT